jgi:hypothetical protein
MARKKSKASPAHKRASGSPWRKLIAVAISRPVMSCPSSVVTTVLRSGGGMQTESRPSFELRSQQFFHMPQPLKLSIHEDAQGKTTFDVGQIKSVGIKNIGNVQSHQINTLFGSRSHVVHFVNGGVLQFAYNAKNELIELAGAKLTLHMSRLQLGEVLFDVYVEGKGDLA